MLNDYSTPLSSFYSVCEIINYVIIIICSLGFVMQFVFFLLSFLRNKKLPVSTNYKRFAVIIACHNEEEVIALTINKIRETTNYPLDKIDFFVCAHNCTDNTYEVAKEAGAIVYKLDDPDPTHRKAAYPIDFLIKKVITEYRNNYDIITKIDADNICDKDFFNKMNDAHNYGYKITRGYIASPNITQNIWTKCSALYYMRDSRISSQVREALHLDSLLDGGAGGSIDIEIYEELGGLGTFDSSDDMDLTLKLLYKKHRIHYVREAIIYNDQVSTFKDTANRNARMAHGLNLIFFRDFFKMPYYAIKNGRLSLIDMFLQLLFIPISFLSLFWIVPYYLITMVFHFCNAYWVAGGVPFMVEWMTPAMSQEQISLVLMSAVIFIVTLFTMYITEMVICVYDGKKQGQNITFKNMLDGILLSPLFMLLYNFFVCKGIITRPKWNKLKRNVEFTNNIN